MNFYEFFLCLKASIKSSKVCRSKYTIHFFLSMFLLLCFFRSIPTTTNFFFLKMPQPSEILFCYFILFKYLWMEIDLYRYLKFTVVNVLINGSVAAFYRYDVSIRIRRRGRYRITLGFWGTVFYYYFFFILKYKHWGMLKHKREDALTLLSHLCICPSKFFPYIFNL